MATTLEMFLAGIALIINTLAILLMYFVGNTIIAPIVNLVSKMMPSGTQNIPVWETTYLMPFIWALLMIFEVIILISFAVVAARRTVIDDFVY